ncbi:CCA tRNA nucleotidyltransferase [Roseomonas marmotae]|uniref:CCA tRNA nucleotidyltransferase n=1 Tax=Roseomonas marmotae TaxID=2768161 RepID=A0ABS3K9D6_9PROT|nr:CCA tRNA nucleotidyltransferase [Roseomonas marmotae]MBO1074079.1 CCA tRNA nucleotidyltransferase [Roseomonas marmotae]QTI78864.1 CCA tRNA nucleotidyltransferase [Roseomonas marmotae]
MTADPPHHRIDPPEWLSRGAPAGVLAALPGARVVGGAVRDLLAGREVHDVDVAVALPPEEASRLLRDAGIKVFETGLAHGTVTAVLEHQPVEVTSLRRDVLTDGRHAQVAWSTDWREDAARRDFTINAMSMDAAGRLWDYFGGREDLAAGRVRFVGDPATRMAEDYLRLLRFFRFQARYGRGAPDAAALAAIHEAVPGLARLSAERVWMELKRLLEAPDPSGALALMREAGVLRAILPEVGEAGPLCRLLAAGAPADPLLRLAALLAPGSGAEGLARRLRFSTAEAERLRRLLDPALRPGPELDGPALRRWLAEVPAGLPADLAWLAEALDGTERAGLRARIAATPRPVFPLQGRDALAAGIPAGPGVGQALARVRRWWLDGGCDADADACRAVLRRH